MSTIETNETDAPQRKTPDERKAMLARHIASRLAQGRRVESQADYQAVLVRGRRPNHVLHLVLTIVTFGFWAIVWLALWIFGGEKREMIETDEWGNVSMQEL